MFDHRLVHAIENHRLRRTPEPRVPERRRIFRRPSRRELGQQDR